MASAYLRTPSSICAFSSTSLFSVAAAAVAVVSTAGSSTLPSSSYSAFSPSSVSFGTKSSDSSPSFGPL